MDMHESDPELVQQCVDGCRDAWCTLVDRYGRLVYSIPRRYRMSDADSEDIVQHVFTLLFRNLRRIEDPDRLSSWLITTTQRECWRQMRRDPATMELLPHSVESDGRLPEQEIHILEQQHLVRRALEQLGGRCEELLTALFLATTQQSYEEIACKLNIPVGSIGPTRARCFSKLETILIELGFDPDE
jgi:RNA polymerase sigma factor (sigma-70 family)